jgi:hypothetical protein
VSETNVDGVVGRDRVPDNQETEYGHQQDAGEQEVAEKLQARNAVNQMGESHRNRNGNEGQEDIKERYAFRAGVAEEERLGQGNGQHVDSDQREGQEEEMGQPAEFLRPEAKAAPAPLVLLTQFLNRGSRH